MFTVMCTCTNMMDDGVTVQDYAWLLEIYYNSTAPVSSSNYGEEEAMYLSTWNKKQYPWDGYSLVNQVI